MPFCSFDRESAMYDVTPIENMFLLEYLPMAPEDYLRVYLYARMLCQYPQLAQGQEDLARALKIDEETVAEAFRYWERQGLVKRLSDKPPSYAFLPMRAMSAPEPMERQYYEFRDFNAALQALFGSNLIHGEIKIANDWVLVMGYEKDAAVRLVEYGLKNLRYSRTNVRGTLKKLDQIALEWAERGVKSLEDVERMIAWEDGSYQAADAVLKQFSQRRRPTKDELRLADKWVHEWGCSKEELLAACGETVKAMKPSFAYLDKVLESARNRSGKHFEALKDVLSQLGSKALPTPATLKSYEEYLARGFEKRTIELAAACQNLKDKHQFADLDRILQQWEGLGLFRADEAEAYVQRQRGLSGEVVEILKLAGSERRPRLEDNEMLEGWKTRFSEEMIRLAAQMSREKGRPMAAIDRQLLEWEKAGISTPEAARAYAPSKGAARADNPALRYEQRAYTEEESEKDFYFDVLKEYGGGQK